MTTPAPALSDLVALVIATPDPVDMDLAPFPLPVLRHYRESLGKHDGALLRYEMWQAVAERIETEIELRETVKRGRRRK